MRSGPDGRQSLIRRYYQAYENDDQPGIEALLDPGFTFTSPDDDNIDLAAYFARCWPQHELIKSFDLLDVCADDDGALVRYRGSMVSGAGFGNVERLEFTGDRISHIEVYFGRELQ
jgi:ketosteroid isomerase-like protein